MHQDLKISQHEVYRTMRRRDLIEQLPEPESQDAAFSRWKKRQADPTGADDAETTYRKGLDLENRREFDAARELYATLLDRFPDLANAACRMGYVLEAQQLPDQARDAYSRAVEADELFDLAFFRLGLMRKQCGDPKGAIAAYQKAIALNPRNGAARNNLGLLLIDEERWEQGEEQFKEILSVYPDARNAKRNLSGARKRVKRSSSGCFIATAAMGSEAADEVAALKRWRDRTLMRTRVGRTFVGAYYRVSPAAAEWLIRHPRWRRWVRDCLVRPLSKAVGGRG